MQCDIAVTGVQYLQQIAENANAPGTVEIAEMQLRVANDLIKRRAIADLHTRHIGRITRDGLVPQHDAHILGRYRFRELTQDPAVQSVWRVPAARFHGPFVIIVVRTGDAQWFKATFVHFVILRRAVLCHAVR